MNEPTMHSKPPMNFMSSGAMWPLNWCAKLSKLCTDLLFHVALCDRCSVLSDLELIEAAIKGLRDSLARVR